MCAAIVATHAGEEQPLVTPSKTPAEIAVQIARMNVNQGKFAEALKEFEAALTMDPKNKETRLLCAETAYWARKPQRALSYFNQIVDEAPRNSNAEYNAVAYRVFIFNALGAHGASRNRNRTAARNKRQRAFGRRAQRRRFHARTYLGTQPARRLLAGVRHRPGSGGAVSLHRDS